MPRSRSRSPAVRTGDDRHGSSSHNRPNEQQQDRHYNNNNKHNSNNNNNNNHYSYDRHRDDDRGQQRQVQQRSEYGDRSHQQERSVKPNYGFGDVRADQRQQQQRQPHQQQSSSSHRQPDDDRYSHDARDSRHSDNQGQYNNSSSSINNSSRYSEYDRHRDSVTATASAATAAVIDTASATATFTALQQMARAKLLSERSRITGTSAVTLSAATAAPAYVSKAQREQRALEQLQQQQLQQMLKFQKQQQQQQQHDDSEDEHQQQQHTEALTASFQQQQQQQESRVETEAQQRQFQLLRDVKMGKQAVDSKRKHTGAQRTKFIFDWRADEDTAAATMNAVIDMQSSHRRGGMDVGGKHSSSNSSSGKDVRQGGSNDSSYRGQQSAGNNNVNSARQSNIDHRQHEQQHNDHSISKSNSKFNNSNSNHLGNNNNNNNSNNNNDTASTAADRYDTSKAPVREHWSSKQLGDMSERDWRIFREDFSISTRGGYSTAAAIAVPGAAAAATAAAADAAAASAVAAPHTVPKPIRYWEECSEEFSASYTASNIAATAAAATSGSKSAVLSAAAASAITVATLPAVLLATLRSVGYNEPTPIQRVAIPCGLRGMDMVGLAETGSGKTCAFLLPMLVHIAKQTEGMSAAAIRTQLQSDGPYSIILAPTRELAQQIADECEKFASCMDITCTSIVGGVSIEAQGVAMRDGIHCIIATPGRLFDCLERHYVVLHQCCYVVLDEADRMIDMNFEPQIVRILDCMPPQQHRQTIMFSATMPAKVEQLSKKYLRLPVFVSVGDRRNKAASTVSQQIVWCSGSDNEKKQKLLQLLTQGQPPFIVFCNTKKACDSVGKYLDQHSLSHCVLHGSMQQTERTANLALFKASQVDILVATDVAGRGIDVNNVQQVINYEMPATIDKYTHRIGRTGRAGKSGIATSLMSDADTDIMFELCEMLRNSKQHVPQQLANHDASKFKNSNIKQLNHE